MGTKSQPNIFVYHPTEAEQYADLLNEQGCTSVSTASKPEQAVRFLPTAEIMLCWDFPKSLLPSLRDTPLKWIQSMGAGMDYLISSPHFPKQVTLTKIVDQFGVPIAEYIFAYLLYLVKDIQQISHAQDKREWNPFITDFLKGKQIGIAGLGSIGREVVRKARSFDMIVYGLSYSGKHAHLVDQHFAFDDWKRFVQELDYLVLTLPLTDQTYHVVNQEILLTMPKNSILINVGRGQLVDEQGLIDILREGHLKAAVLDVFEQEPLVEDHPFWTLPNVIVTPHLSGPSIPQNVVIFFMDNLVRYSNGETLKGQVNIEKGY